ncbi:Eco57I restriction-modification methylase domain-containing protein [Saccharibacillus kuerlensis]|uniref:site-specific DNA-methyltransferase (adenine-specific) n=1 Tax=Saccharibacillus kuerlensis TaxID=459527 RepID=A0ABQ2KXV2_9BACL|nr:Eco57I restriction-modification methylase domain-containing protein [Saccharibacillus kuerlensis]GGN94973.1 SAM-dependent methyltransferase [Saccharibacillus kuerlensis]
MGFIIEKGVLVFKEESMYPVNFSNMLSTISESARQQLDAKNKEGLEQFFTDIVTAAFMASLFQVRKKKKIRILDAGAGAGILGAAVIKEICSWEEKPKEIYWEAFEIDKSLSAALQETLTICHQVCSDFDIKFTGKIVNENFIHSSVQKLPSATAKSKFDLAILNPPYQKLSSNSKEKKLLASIDLDVTNLYSAFVALSKRWLLKDGELVAITPRSFCNGQYFKRFREELVKDTMINHFHLFESRSKVFAEDNVLQENVIYHLINKKPVTGYEVTLTFSQTKNFENIETNKIRFEELVLSDDPLLTIRLIKDISDVATKNAIEGLPCTLENLGLTLSTGPVVDFREEKSTLLKEPSPDSVPLIYPEHFNQGIGKVLWPKVQVKKYNSILISEKLMSKLRPRGNYVLVKRMTSKEEKRRVVAAVYEESLTGSNLVAFENKVNYYHINRNGLDLTLAKGLSLFLNSTLVDLYFRQFSGNTQVNATDLRSIKYPTIQQLVILGKSYETELPSQEVIDRTFEEVCLIPSEQDM